jgi:hypothetical protein
MRRPTLLAVPLPALLLVVGCTPTYSFQVAVRNETKGPVTMGLVKEGGRGQPQWRTPESAAMGAEAGNERAWDSIVVPPGKTGYAGPVKGKFENDSRAVLRVYAGDLDLSDVLAISRGSPNRADIALEEGRNAIIVKESGGRLVYDRVEVPQPKKK